MPAWFIPALIFVGRTAAPFVARHLLGVGARQLGAATVKSVATKAAIGGGAAFTANMGTQALEYGTNWDEYQVGAAVGDALVTAASVGAGVAIFPAAKGAVTFRQVATTLGGQAAIQTALGGARILVMDSDPMATMSAAWIQILPSWGRRFAIARIFAKHGGMNSVRGVIVDQVGSLSQEIVTRRMFGVMPGSGSTGASGNNAAPGGGMPIPKNDGVCTKLDPTDSFLDANVQLRPAHHLDFHRAWGQCQSCH